MNPKEFLKVELERIKMDFANAIFKYEYFDIDRTHIIETNPQTVFDSDAFIDFRIALRNKFYKSYPTEEILYVSSDSLNQVLDPEFVVSSYQFVKPKKYYTLITSSKNVLEIAGENNYALAA